MCRNMNRLVLILALVAMCLPMTASAQQPESAGAARLAALVNVPHTEWLGSFDRIYINGKMQVRLVKISGEDGPKIVYDTKGSTTTRFKVEVDKKGTLNVEESIDPKRATITEVTIYYPEIKGLVADAADVSFDNPFEAKMFDLEVSGGANLNAEIRVLDLQAEVTGKSSVVLTGEARYMRLNISTAKFDASNFSTVSSIIGASHGAEVSIAVSERLEAETSTSAKVSYKGNPAIMRTYSSLFGGEITQIVEQ